MMLTPWQIPCPANTIRGELKHSWLENDICCTSPQNIVDRKTDGTWDDDAKIKKFTSNIQSTKKLSRDMINGFSPALLVDRLGPLRSLSEETRMSLKKGVHAAYMESSGITELAEELERKITAFAEEFKRFCKVYGDGDDNRLKTAWEGLSAKADDLLDVLKKLPKGVVLP